MCKRHALFSAGTLFNIQTYLSSIQVNRIDELDRARDWRGIEPIPSERKAARDIIARQRGVSACRTISTNTDSSNCCMLDREQGQI